MAKKPTDQQNMPEPDQMRQRTNEEQMLSRQSAPQPTAMDDALRMLQARQREQMLNGQGVSGTGAVNGFRALEQPIGAEALKKATDTLNRYKAGKANLENRVIAEEQWYKLRHWDFMDPKKKEQVEPTSAWLFNSLANKHADAMDNFPSPNVLPREEGDKGQALMLTSILPVILDHGDFEETYDEASSDKLKFGTAIYGVFWSPTEMNGLGDVVIRNIDLLSIFWEPGIRDIQKSRNVFVVELMDNDILEAQYPQLKGRLGGEAPTVSKYIYDESIDTSNKSAVIDWYYKRPNSQGRMVLQYCKFVNDTVLYATENQNQPQTDMMGNMTGLPMSERGLYDHGQYPFVFDTLFRVKESPAAFGYISVAKSCQEYIDRGNQAIMQNMLANSKPRHFIRNDGSVNEAEYSDMTKDFVHVDGNLGQDSILPIQGKPLSPIYSEVIKDKIDELKETTGNRDISTGGSTSGVTAASAIAAMQEAGSKLSRDNNKASYRAFRKVCMLCIELIRQFYDLPRCFRIMGENGTEKFVMYSNAGIVPQGQGEGFSVDIGLRIPQFDIEVTAQKQSPYSKMSQNELALQFYEAGFFNPSLADQALACIDMMDFDRKDFIAQKIQQNGGMVQQMLMMAQIIDSMRGGNEFTMNIAQQFNLPMAQGQEQAPSKAAEKNDTLGGDSGPGEATNTKKARQRVAESTSPT